MNVNEIIDIISMRLTSNKNGLKAFCDVRVGSWIVKDFRIWKQNGRTYVSVPQASWRDQSGQIRFKPILTIPGEQLEKIQTAILYHYHRETEKENERETK